MKIELNIKFEPNDFQALAAFASNADKWKSIGKILEGAFREIKDEFDEAGQEAIDKIEIEGGVSIGGGNKKTESDTLEPPEGEM